MYQDSRFLTGEVVIPSDPNYNEARQGYNEAIQQYPLVIVYCSSKYDVSNAICWAKTYRIPIRIRSGGHNYEGYSNGDSTLIIDISRMNQIEIDSDSSTLYAEGGVNNGQVYQYAASRGYPFPGGTCPTVGVSGYASGGGWGLSCRNFGLGCDSLTEIELVNYAGQVIKASSECNSDLFWALRGAGGGNFGIIVSMTFRLPQKVEKVTLIEIDYINVSQLEQKEFISVWQEWLKIEDYRLTLISRIYHSENDGYAMLVRGIFYGSPEEANVILTPFLALNGAKTNIEQTTFLEAVTIIGSVYPPSEKFQSGSRFAIRDFSLEEISEITDLIKELPSGSVFAGISMYALGGKVAQIGTDETAFFYREAKYIMWLDTIWEENEYAKVNKIWLKKQFSYLRRVTTGSYVNFPYRKLSCYLDEYYGDHVDRLEEIKKSYDPRNIFSFPQGIHGTKSFSYLPHIEKEVENGRGERSVQVREEQYRGFRYVR